MPLASDVMYLWRNKCIGDKTNITEQKEANRPYDKSSLKMKYSLLHLNLLSSWSPQQPQSKVHHYLRFLGERVGLRVFTVESDISKDISIPTIW
jgi:hypothetical protein